MDIQDLALKVPDMFQGKQGQGRKDIQDLALKAYQDKLVQHIQDIRFQDKRLQGLEPRVTQDMLAQHIQDPVLK